MEYVDKLQTGLQYMVDAGEAGRTQVGGMLSPVTNAASWISGAADDLESLPFVGPAIGAKLSRVMGAIGSAQSKVNQVLGTYDRAVAGVDTVKERLGGLDTQVDRAKAAVGKLAAKVSPEVQTVVPTAALAPKAANPTPMPEAVGASAHLMVLMPAKGAAQPFYFNIDTAAHSELQRTNAYRWAAQERLGRRPGMQAVGIGEEKITMRGVIFGAWKGGIKQLDKLRTIGNAMVPLGMTTGYGLALGNWCLMNISEDQGFLLKNGAPRKQTWTLEFSRYGDDLQNG
jgi:phage protein U